MSAADNPWLDIPLSDYEGHMSLPHIGQAHMIATQLATLIRAHAPKSVAVVGCAGGNGFEHLTAPGIERVVGIDINPDYIKQARERHAARIPGLELHVANIESPALLHEPVELIYAALVFEYVDVGAALRALHRNVLQGGLLAVLLQVPHDSLAQVSPSPYTSLQRLGPGMRLVSPDELAQRARQVGFMTLNEEELTSPAGKRFALLTLRANPTQPNRGQ